MKKKTFDKEEDGEDDDDDIADVCTWKDRMPTNKATMHRNFYI